jgi:hypothetical protein
LLLAEEEEEGLDPSRTMMAEEAATTSWFIVWSKFSL